MLIERSVCSISYIYGSFSLAFAVLFLTGLTQFNRFYLPLNCSWFDNSHHSYFIDQGIIDMNRNGNFCKGTCFSKIIAETKVDARVEQQKKVHRSFPYVSNGKFAVFWVLCCGITGKRALFPSIDLYFY